MRFIGFLFAFALAAAACRRGFLFARDTPAPEVNEDTILYGRAHLEGARFTALGFAAPTGKDGEAKIVIPGGWDQPVKANMAPPQGGPYTLIGPEEVELRSSGPTSADFLFAASQAARIASPTPADAEGTTLAGSGAGLDAPGSVHRNVTYCRPLDGVELKMDVYQPAVIKRASPVVVYVHGGGWTSGSKDDEIGRLFGQTLGQRGYLTVAINYRLAPQYQFPAQIEDVKCAIRYLRAHAEEYRLDPQRIAAFGASAGGHLAALLGTSDPAAGFDVGEYTDQSSRVQAVVDLFGPSDLVTLMHESLLGVGDQVFGVNTMDPEKIAPYSPVTYITPDDPPFLIMHGEQDQLVPIEQSEILYKQLTAAGIPAQFVRVGNAGHAFRPTGGEMSPKLLDLVQIIIEFLDGHLVA